MTEKLKTALAGSFKFKPEIDKVHDEFTELGVEVLEPSKGWLIIPQFEAEHGYRPLPGEEYLAGIKEIEERFLKAIKKSDFLYVCNFHNYLGTSTALELGFALADDKPIFSVSPVNLPSEDRTEWIDHVISQIQVANPQETIAIMNKRLT